MPFQMIYGSSTDGSIFARQAHRVAAAHQHTTAENMELTVPRLEALVRRSLESSGVVLCKGGALALRRVFQFYDRQGRGALPAPQFRLALEKRFQVSSLGRLLVFPPTVLTICSRFR